MTVRRQGPCALRSHRYTRRRNPPGIRGVRPLRTHLQRQPAPQRTADLGRGAQGPAEAARKTQEGGKEECGPPVTRCDPASSPREWPTAAPEADRMDKIILIILGAAGATIAVTHTPVGKPLRALGKPFTCPACLGFWTGLLATIAANILPDYITIPALAGLSTSFLAYTLSAHATWVDKLGSPVQITPPASHTARAENPEDAGPGNADHPAGPTASD